MSEQRRVLGEQISYAAKVIAAHSNPYDAGGRVELATQYTRVVMQVVVSLAVLATGIYLLLEGGSDKQREIGSGLVGIVVGYWLR